MSIHFEMYKILLFPVEQCTTDIIFRMLQSSAIEESEAHGRYFTARRYR
ncbi:MAG: hypothetical protein ACLU3N_07965 [Lachnospiraceae bacterium]